MPASIQAPEAWRPLVVGEEEGAVRIAPIIKASAGSDLHAASVSQGRQEGVVGYGRKQVLLRGVCMESE